MSITDDTSKIQSAINAAAINLLDFVPVQVVVGGKVYTYKHLNEGPQLTVRQPVIVSFGMKGLTVGIVESINQIPLDPNAKFQYKWIVAPLDLAPYEAILAAEAAVTVPA